MTESLYYLLTNIQSEKNGDRFPAFVGVGLDTSVSSFFEWESTNDSKLDLNWKRPVKYYLLPTFKISELLDAPLP